MKEFTDQEKEAIIADFMAAVGPEDVAQAIVEPSIFGVLIDRLITAEERQAILDAARKHGVNA